MSNKTTSVSTAFEQLSKYLVEQEHPQNGTLSYRIKPEFLLQIIIKNRKKTIQSITYNSDTNMYRIKVSTREGFYTTVELHGNCKFSKTIIVNMLLVVDILGNDE